MERIKAWLLSLGIYKSVFTLTILSIFISLGLTTALMSITGGEMSRPAITAAIVTPGVTAALFSFIILRLLFDLDAAEKKFKELSRQDPLTGISNRRYFLEMAERELERAKRYGVEFAVVMFDLNEFKWVNDKFGHVVGDKVLHEIAQKIQSKIRQTDLIARWGGDEFVVLVSQSKNVDLDQYCNRLRNIIHEITVEEKNYPIKVTASIGAKRFSDNIFSINEIIHLADRDMYLTKEEEWFKW
jgi:diguanylate cyclase (GGDEF)-like protein